MENSVKFKTRYLDMLQMVKREYATLSLENRVNVYTCKNGHQFKTIDVDKGVTPFMKMCLTCKEPATSAFYEDTRPDLQPIIEWYRPTMQELAKMDRGVIDRVLQGGLCSREIKCDNFKTKK